LAEFTIPGQAAIGGDAYYPQTVGNITLHAASASAGTSNDIKRDLRADSIPRQEMIRMDEERKNKGSGNPLYLIGSILGIVAAIIAVLQFAGVSHFQDLLPAVSAADRTPTPNNPYNIARATLILDDPLIDNSKGVGWDQINVSDITCKLDSTGYTDDVKSNWAATCAAKAPSFQALRNYIFEVGCSLRAGTNESLPNGSAYGISFRDTFSPLSLYIFQVAPNGAYSIVLQQPPAQSRVLTSGTITTPFNHGTVSFNTLAVAAIGAHITFYVNYVQVATIQDSTLQTGTVGVYAYSGKDAPETQVIYSSARVWQLP
jgi:hypothetical protein